VSGKKILLIDDDPDSILVTTRSLTNASYLVTEARDENEAMNKAQSEAFDLFIIDLQLHNDNAESGLKLLGELPRNTPKIVWSVSEDPSIVRSAFDQPVHASRPRTYVFKRSEGTRVLLDKVRVVLAEEEDQAEERSRLQDEVKRLRGIIDKRDQSRKRTLRVAGSILLTIAIVTAATLASSPQWIGDKLSQNVMLTGIASSLVASLISFLFSVSRKPTA
jgi:CheY-like chemotaxis protein